MLRLMRMNTNHVKILPPDFLFVSSKNNGRVVVTFVTVRTIGLFMMIRRMKLSQVKYKDKNTVSFCVHVCVWLKRLIQVYQLIGKLKRLATRVIPNFVNYNNDLFFVVCNNSPGWICIRLEVESPCPHFLVMTPKTYL